MKSIYLLTLFLWKQFYLSLLYLFKIINLHLTQMNVFSPHLILYIHSFHFQTLLPCLWLPHIHLLSYLSLVRVNKLISLSTQLHCHLFLLLINLILIVLCYVQTHENILSLPVTSLTPFHPLLRCLNQFLHQFTHMLCKQGLSTIYSNLNSFLTIALPASFLL